MNDSIAKASLKFFWKDILGDLVGFPLWWYTKGTLRIVQFIMRHALKYAQTLNIRIWVKNMFVPMYSQYDVAGRIISFVLRVFILIYRIILFAVWLVVLFALLALWMLGPILVVYYILYQIFNVSLGL